NVHRARHASLFEVCAAASIDKHCSLIRSHYILNASEISLHGVSERTPNRETKLVAFHVRVTSLHQLGGNAFALSAEWSVAIQHDWRRLVRKALRDRFDLLLINVDASRDVRDCVFLRETNVEDWSAVVCKNFLQLLGMNFRRERIGFTERCVVNGTLRARVWQSCDRGNSQRNY